MEGTDENTPSPTEEKRPTPAEVIPKRPPFIKPAAPADKQQEAKLMAKFPNLQGGRGSALLQKRLNHGKYFDSGDYNVAMAKMNNPKVPLNSTEKLILKKTIGEAIPKPDDLPQRKPSIASSKLAAGELGQLAQLAHLT